MTKQEFINYVYPYAIKAGKQLGIDPSYIVAHWAHETGYGNNKGFQINNLAGYMAYPGSPYGETGKPFDSLDSFVDAYVSLLRNDRYKQVFSAKSSTDFAKALQAGGYATDPYYASAGTWTEAIELLKSYSPFSSSPYNGVFPSNNQGSSSIFDDIESGNYEEEIPNILKDPSGFFGWLGSKTKYYFAMILLFILLIFLGYVVFIKDSSINESMQDIAKAMITKGG